MADPISSIPPEAPLEPNGPYAASKAAQSIAASALCREKGINLAILRLFTVFGEGQNPVNLWPSLKRAAPPLPMTPGEQIRDFIPVEQVAHAFLKALGMMSGGEVEGLRTGISPTSPQLATRHPSLLPPLNPSTFPPINPPFA